MLLHNATFLTQSPETPVAEALLLVNGRIAAAGTLSDVEAAAPAGVPRVDLGGAAVLPGFNDAHVHVWKVGALRTAVLDVRGVQSIAVLKDRLRAFAAERPAAPWIQARGYNEATMAEGRHPTAADLDDAVPCRPVYLIRTCAHIAVASSAALRAAGVTAATDPPPGGVIERHGDGSPTGVLHETALGLVAGAIPPPTRAEYEEMILAGSRELLRHGVTAATDPAVTPELLEAWRALDARGALPIRTNLLAIRRPDGGTQTLPLPEWYESDFLNIDGVKFFADGGLSGATAALQVPYRHAPTTGVLRFEDEEELLLLAREAHLAGLTIATHAIGDRAIEQILRVYEKLYRYEGGPRHRIEHFGLPSPDHLARAAAMHIGIATQPVFLTDLGDNFAKYLPDQYLRRVYPFRSMLAAGLEVAFSTDAPVVRDVDPLRGLRAALRRHTASGRLLEGSERVTAAQAIYAYTRAGALLSGREDLGLLAPGCRADLAVLNKNPLDLAEDEWEALRVQRVMVEGEFTERE